jgi:hypothetical protein
MNGQMRVLLSFKRVWVSERLHIAGIRDGGSHDSAFLGEPQENKHNAFSGSAESPAITKSPFIFVKTPYCDFVCHGNRQSIMSDWAL